MKIVVENGPLFAPNRLFSLWDMMDFFAKDLVEVINRIEYFKQRAIERGPGRQTLPEERDQIIAMLAKALPLFEKLELVESAGQIRILQNRIVPMFMYMAGQAGTDALRTCFENLQAVLERELGDKKLLYIPLDRVQFFQRDNLFGSAFHANTPTELNDHIKAAGNAIAIELYNGAAFHLLCAVNIGLVVLARHLRVIIKKTPLEFAEWQKMIEKIDKKLKQKSIRVKGNRQHTANAKKFCLGAMNDLKRLKELRNEVMHARANYNRDTIIVLWGDVKDFMQRLSNEVSLK